MAIEYARQGKITSIISNGDANVFGMGTLVVELLDEKDLWDEIEIISLPGVTSFLAAASKVGAPISQDFAVISLSDKLTDINLIDKRVKLALEGNFVLGIYNPKSKKRIKPYVNFLKALEKYDERIAVIASHVGREDKEKITITNTTELIKEDIQNPLISMSTLIIVCNSNTRLTSNGLVLTPRGYLNKYEINGELK
jgi:precorrin-3B C17-methyltransferase